MKGLDFTPIYKGEYNMTPQQYKEYEEESCEPDIIIEYDTISEWLVLLMCAAYIILACLR